MKIIARGLFLILILLGQNSLLNGFYILGVRPNLTLLLVIYVMINKSIVPALYLAILGPVVPEILYEPYVGVSSISFTIMVVLSNNFEDEIVNKKYYPIFAVVFGTLCYYFVFSFIGFFLGLEYGFRAIFLGIVLREVIANCILIYPFLLVTRFFDRLLTERKTDHLKRVSIGGK